MIADTGERQVAMSREGIRRDHTARYEWVAQRCKGLNVVDAGCGVGYGSQILAESECIVDAYDYSDVAIEFAKAQYNHDDRINYRAENLYDASYPDEADAVVAFEVIEHLAKPERVLRKWHGIADKLYASVPNEEKFPYRGYKHHVRHYTKEQFGQLLLDNGWMVDGWWGQEGPHSLVEKDVDGRTLVVEASRIDCDPIQEPLEKSGDDVLESLKLPGRDLPKSVAIVAMGRSREAYFMDATRLGDHSLLADEVWAINAMGGTIQCDRIIHMDDVTIQESRAELGVNNHIGGMLNWMRDGDVPVYTSRVYEGYKALVEYPLEWVINEFQIAYFNNTIPYAFALAIAMGVKKIHLYGCDYSYQNYHKREKGRGCLEFWIGVASQRGVQVVVPEVLSTILDADVPERDRLYGYDTEWITLEPHDNGYHVVRVPRSQEDIPTARQIESRYSHDPRLEKRGKI